MRPTIEHDGIVYTYKEEHGSWLEDYEREAIGTAIMPANFDGSPALDEVGDIEITYYEGNAGPCEARCALCLREQAAELLREADEWEALHVYT